MHLFVQSALRGLAVACDLDPNFQAVRTRFLGLLALAHDDGMLCTFSFSFRLICALKDTLFPLGGGGANSSAVVSWLMRTALAWSTRAQQTTALAFHTRPFTPTPLLFAGEQLAC